MPRLFVVIENSSCEVVYTSTLYSKASAFFRSLPDSISDCFSLVRYDANENWKPENNINERKQ